MSKLEGEKRVATRKLLNMLLHNPRDTVMALTKVIAAQVVTTH